MKPWLILLTMALFALGAFLLSCDNDDDDDNDDCDCDDDDDDDNDAADDDAADDDDSLGTGAGAQQCLDDLKPPFYDCRAVCDDEEDQCVFYHCLYGCFAEMFTGALACAEAYPELADMVDYWQCNHDCELVFRTCVEPLDDCDFDVMIVCLDELQTCEAGCSVGSPL